MPPSTESQPPARGLDQSGLDHLLGYQLAQAEVPMRALYFRHIGEPLKLRPVEFSILMLLAFNPGATAKKLSQALAVSAPNLTVLLERLLERGLIERQRSESDRRTQHIHLTQTGLELARRSHEISRTMEQELTRHFSDGERALLKELLARIARHKA
ncbi:MAG: MarR family winged helix-turn-helix transcriptional regulator [Pseudomonadota bacterium]